MRIASNPVVLRDISSFHGAEYNPRKMVPERLEQVKVSLAKLGFILPIYVNKNGVILSGHQRTTAAKMYGYTKVPVVELDVPDQAEKGLNVIFNKGTNDMDTFVGQAKDAFVNYLEQATNLVANLPDIPPDTVYPCMNTRRIGIQEAMTTAGVDVSVNIREAGYSMVDNKIFMPLVMSGGKIINGKGRVYGAAAKNYDELDVVDIPEAHADYAYLALNFLAMDFDIQSHFKDELRYNAFRRRSVQSQIVGLSRTYPYFVYDRVISNTALKYALLEGQTNKDLMLLPTATEEARKKFQDRYGKVIFDMGAGTLHDAHLMQQAGFDVTPFEPFYCPPGVNEPSSTASRELNAKVLDRLEALDGDGPDSIISSFVLNSIPHHRDRMAYLTILAAMAKLKTGVFIGTQNVKNIASEGLAAHLRLNADEPNVTLGNDTRFFKAQKFYYKEELQRMLEFFFATVTIKEVANNLFAECRNPKRPSASLLKEALELEFEMPYKDGNRMGLSQRAKEVFSKHTGMPLV